MRTANERGIALITTLLILMLMSALAVGFTTVVMSDQRFRGIDRDRSQAFYAAHSGLEKLTVDLGALNSRTLAPTGAQLTALATDKPALPGITFHAAGAAGSDPAQPNEPRSGYTIRAQAPQYAPISSGPFEGLMANKTVYDLDSTARTNVGGEVHLSRRVETVAIPVFQFGMFSDMDLSFFAGPDFTVSGRVHTNGHLFLAEGDGTLTLRDKVTAFKQVVREFMSNGVSIDTAPSHTGTVSVATAPGAFRPLARTEGSVVGDENSGPYGSWRSVSLDSDKYAGYIRNGDTGAKKLDLPLLTAGGANADLVRRPVVNEDTGNPALFSQRLFSQASLRILLSDTAADIMSLPGISAGQPVLLDGNWNTAPLNTGTVWGLGPSRPPIATSRGLFQVATAANVAAGATTIALAAALPALWQPGTMTVTAAGGAILTVTCTGRLPDQFVGCTGVTDTIPSNRAMQTTVNSVTHMTDTRTGTPAGSTTIDVDDTAGFAASWFWAGSQLVTCGGSSAAATQLTECTVTAAIPAGTVLSTYNSSTAGTGTVGGFIKIERQNNAGVWLDVTMEILNHGIAGPNLSGAICADANTYQNAILQIQRLRDNSGNCSYGASVNSWDYWPNTLFDAREGLQRDTAPGGSDVRLGGVMHYIGIDVRNLSRWFQGIAPYNGGSGVTANNAGGAGYSVYFSDRRNNRNLIAGSLVETGEYGWEDFVNPADAAGAPDGTLDVGEDVNQSTLLDVYGGVPNYYDHVAGAFNAAPPGASGNLVAGATPRTSLPLPEAMVNRAILFRRALKLVNGGLGNIVMPGLTIASENPVYVQGNWNANAAGFGDPHAATSVIADAVTLLSNNWNDITSYRQPYAPGNRPRNSQTYYRLAIIAGKGQSFPRPAGTPTDFGTDGGAHNFLRYLERGDQAVNYRGSIVTFFHNRQGTGTFKCCSTVYEAPTRNYVFDIDFQDPALLPPLTPVLRDLNTLGFYQETRPGR